MNRQIANDPHVCVLSARAVNSKKQTKTTILCLILKLLIGENPVMILLEITQEQQKEIGADPFALLKQDSVL